MSVNDKQHLSEVVFSVPRIFIVRKVSGLRAGTARSRREPYQESKEPGEPQESSFR